jgi:hypothetical protein
MIFAIITIRSEEFEENLFLFHILGLVQYDYAKLHIYITLKIKLSGQEIIILYK